jgi:hypothetical protein
MCFYAKIPKYASYNASTSESSGWHEEDRKTANPVLTQGIDVLIINILRLFRSRERKREE